MLQFRAVRYFGPSEARAFGDAGREAAQDARQERREEISDRQQAAWRESVAERNPEKAKPVAKGLEVLDGITGVVSKLADFMLDFLVGSSSSQDDKPVDISDPAARRERQLAQIAARQQERASEKAIDSIREDMEGGRRLKSEDIANLTRAHQDQIKLRGDDAVRQMVDDAQKQAERHWRGDERER
jgi:hypothetical protein